MTTDSKPQPTGWVVVDFANTSYMPFRGEGCWYRMPECSQLVPFNSESDARKYVRYSDEVHRWPLPASVLARLKERHPTVDWSQVPVAVDAEKPGRWVLEDGSCRDPYRDQDGWQQSVGACSKPWPTKGAVEEYMRATGWNPSCVRPVNLDDLPEPAVAEPSEVEKLRAEVERLTRERDEARAELDRTMRERDAMEERVNCIAQELGLSEEECQWSNVNDVGVVAASRAARLLSDVEDLREQLGKATLSRRDEFAKAALTGMLADPAGSGDPESFATEAVLFADATIRALDGAGGA